jgi:hypothetical protein
MTIDEVKVKVVPILKRYGVKRAAVFGSLVRGEDTETSDIDILVDLPKKASLLDLAGLKIDLEELLGREVDVITYDSINPLLKDRILSEEVAIL